MKWCITDKDQYRIWDELLKTLSGVQIASAITKISNSFPDDRISPSRFRFLAYGLVDVDIAHQLAQKKDWRHPAIYHAAKDSGMLNKYGTQDEEVQWRKFRRSYNYFIDEVLSGKVLDMPGESLKIESPVFASNEAWKSYVINHFNATPDQLKAITENWTPDKCQEEIKSKIAILKAKAELKNKTNRLV